MTNTTHPLRNDGLTGRNIDGSCTVRGYAYPLLTGYCDWENIVVYDDHVKIGKDHPKFRYDLEGKLMVVWITARDDGSFGIHCWGRNRDFGSMHHAETLDDALDQFHKLRGHKVTEPTLF